MSSVKHVTAPDCGAILELIPDYAFGLTSPDETRFVEANLTACPEALAELEDFRRIQDDMRESVPQVEPSAQFEARLFAAIRLETNSAPAPQTIKPQPVVTPVEAPVPALTLVKEPQAQPAERSQRRPLPFAWLAAGVAVAALLLTNGYWMAQVNGLNERMVRLENDAVIASQESFVLDNSRPLNWSRMTPDEGTGIEAAAFLMWNA
ncbi:MAG: hypothetical protein H7175_11835, partial [Burkholderiales bacterium]|nr:hypothetical protein [Anaerolineae bacterium]